MKLGTSYFGVRNPYWVEKDLEIMKKSGLSYVVHTFSEEDLRFYRKTMAKIVELTKSLKLEAWLDPWGLGNFFGGEAFSAFLYEHPETWQTKKDGSKFPQPCINHPQFKKFVKNWISTAKEIGADGIFLDEPHFKLKDTCYCEYCREKFRELHGIDIEKAEKKLLDEFKKNQLENFLLEIINFARSLNLKVSICLMPNKKDQVDWNKIAESPIDILSSDPYPGMFKSSDAPEIFETIKEVKELAAKNGKESEIWIQGFLLKKSETGYVKHVKEFAKKLGIDRLALWSYRGTPYMSYIAPEEPEAIWQAFIE